jgi:hypothetical protein
MFPRVTHPSATPYCYGVRLACVRPAASVRSEPGSNSQVVVEIISRLVTVSVHQAHAQQTKSTSSQAHSSLRFSAQQSMAQETCDRRLSLGLELTLETRKDNRRPRFSFFRCNCQTADDQTPGVTATAFSDRFRSMSSIATHPSRSTPVRPVGQEGSEPRRSAVRLRTKRGIAPASGGRKRRFGKSARILGSPPKRSRTSGEKPVKKMS